MSTSIIGIVFDFDGTLGPDTIASLLSKNSISPKIFWEEVDVRVKDGWDPPQAYMQLLLEYAQRGEIEVSPKALRSLGSSLKLYPGLPQAFTQLRTYVRRQQELEEAGVQLEFYIISGGIEEIIRGSALSGEMDGIFGCNFDYDRKGKPICVKSTISFTEKTRYLYGLNKGISTKDLRANPYKINDSVPREIYRIPFPQMIYIGDGPSDIPCLSAISQNGGTGIGVSSSDSSFRKGYELARGKRITVGPYTANYKKSSDMRKVLEETILRIGLEIAINKKKNIVTSPQMG